MTIETNTFDVKGVLIDLGSLSEIMYHNMFEKLKLLASQIKSADSPVFSFIGEVVWPIAILEVPVRLGPIQKIVEFIVMNINFPYNAILGRGWIGRMRAVASPYHGKLKFLSKYGIVEIKRKQENASYYFGLAVQSALAEKHPVELVESLGGKGEEVEQIK